MLIIDTRIYQSSNVTYTDDKVTYVISFIVLTPHA